MPRDRGIARARVFGGGFLDAIEGRIGAKGRVRILDAGCGHGVAMLDLVKRFGAGVELVGFNSSRRHGGPRLMRREALRKGLFSEDEYRRLGNKPRFVYLDASRRLPFASGSFDFIYSMSAIYLFADKARFFEECNRVLRKGGLARLEAAYLDGRKPKEYSYPWEIWDEGKRVRLEDYLARFAGIRAVADGDVVGIELRKRPRLDLGLKLLAAVDSNLIWHRWMGVKSIYTTQRTSEPYWR